MISLIFAFIAPSTPGLPVEYSPYLFFTDLNGGYTSPCAVAMPNTDSLQTAVSSWCDSPTSAEATYGDIGGWNTSGVESFANLFYYDTEDSGICSSGQTFNADISGWDVSRVTSMVESKSGGDRCQ